MPELLSPRHTYFFVDEEELDLDKRVQLEIPPCYQRIGHGKMQNGDLILHRHSPLPDLNFSMFRGEAELAEIEDLTVRDASNSVVSYMMVLRPVTPGGPAIEEKALCDRCHARVRDEPHEWRYCTICGMHISDEEKEKRHS